jgi:hypothetical protein
MVRIAGDVDAAKENYDVALNGATIVDITEEADGIVHRTVGRHMDAAAELDNVIVGEGW